jgi:uncharacterized protein YpmS
MPSIEIKDLLMQVITSWQVLFITGAIIVYMYLVTYVARTYHRPRASRMKPKRAKREKAAVITTDDESLND